MIHRIVRCAAGALVLAALSWPALAEESPIDFVSGPLAGAAAKNPKHTEEQASEGSGTVRSDTATFSAGEFLAYVDWSRLPGGYRWNDTDHLGSLAESVQRWLKATGFSMVRGDRTTVNSFLAQYRIISLSGTSDSCAVFDLRRANHMILGAVCRSRGGEVPVMAVLQGLSIDNVIGP